jgi:hypothetical protein
MKSITSRGDIQRILQERPEPPHRSQLQRETSPHVLSAMPPDQLQVTAVQEEHTIKVRLRRASGIPSVPGRLVIRQELNRHGPHRKTANAIVSPVAVKPLQALSCPAPSDIGTASGDNEARIGSLTPTIVPLSLGGQTLAWLVP